MKLYALAVLVVLFAVSGAFAAPFTSEKGGFSIDLPNGWEPLPKDQLDSMAGNGVYLMAMDQAAMQTGKSLSLLISKISVPGENLTAKELASMQAEQFKAAPGTKDLNAEVVTLGGTEWAKLTCTVEANGMTTAQAMFTSVKDETRTVIAFTVDNLSAYESAINKSVESFKAK